MLLFYVNVNSQKLDEKQFFLWFDKITDTIFLGYWILWYIPLENKNQYSYDSLSAIRQIITME